MRICSGALVGREGIVVRNKNSVYVVLTLEQIMQRCAVEVDLEDLQPLTSAELPLADIPDARESVAQSHRNRVDHAFGGPFGCRGRSILGSAALTV